MDLLPVLLLFPELFISSFEIPFNTSPSNKKNTPKGDLNPSIMLEQKLVMVVDI